MREREDRERGTKGGPPSEPAVTKRLVLETPGMLKWAARLSGEQHPVFVVTLLAATKTKMEELHQRRLTSKDLDVGVRRAVGRAQSYLESSGAQPEEVTVMVRDSDLAELEGRVVGPTADVPT